MKPQLRNGFRSVHSISEKKHCNGTVGTLPMWITIHYGQYFKKKSNPGFGTNEMNRPFDAFATLKQTTTVRAHLSQFEQISGLLDKLQPEYIIDKFYWGQR